MIFRKAKKEDFSDILNLYNDAKKSKFCVWSDEYPSLETIKFDYQDECLYVACIDEKIVGALSVEKELELDFDIWKVKDNVIEITRVVVDKDNHCKNIAVYMVSNIIDICKKENIKAVHLACHPYNIPAVKTYQKLGFVFYDEVEIFNNIYNLCEYVI